MAHPPMTIRNLTSTPIKIQRYEIHQRHGGQLGKVTKNVTSIFSSSKTHPLVCDTVQEVSVEIPVSSTSKVDITPANAPHEILCVFFEIRNKLYQTNIMHQTRHSQYLMAVDESKDAPLKHISIYHPQHHHLILAYRNSYSSWMQRLSEETPLSALSIPGTHNSPTYHRALPSVRCQVTPVREQLKRGVRFLDVRVQPEHPSNPTEDGLALVHGVFPISLTGPRHFRSMVDEVLSFLAKNPTESIIMSVKREGPGSATDAQLSRIMRDHYANDDHIWFTQPRVPFLGEARGKIVLVRRFALDESLRSEWGGTGWCIDAESWADNNPHSLCPSGNVCIQDFYEVLETESIEKKIQYSIEHLQRAAQRVSTPPSQTVANEKQPFFINFLTASNFWKVGCWPDRIAAKLNPAIVEHLCLKHNEEGEPRGDGSTGIVVCDWVGHNGDWDIVRCIVGMNARYEKRANE